MTFSHIIAIIMIAVPIIGVMCFSTTFCSRILWVILFCYPSTLAMNLLPLNVGIDDLYIFALGTILLLKRLGSGQAVFGFAIRGALFFWIITSISDMTGALTGPSFLMENAIKTALKGVGYVAFGFIMDNTIDDRKDMESALRWMIFGGLCGTITVMGQVFYEPLFRIFTPYKIEDWMITTGDIAGGGSFITKGAAGMMMLIFTVFCLVRLGIRSFIGFKPLWVVMCFLFSTALILTQSRAAWAGTTVTIFFLMLFSPLRKYAFIVAIVGLIAFSKSELVQRIFFMRLGGGQAGLSAFSRVEIWFTIMRNASPFMLFCGRGAVAEFSRLGATPHNTYIHILFELGLFGAAWAIWFFGKLAKTSLFLKKYGDDEATFTARWILYCLLGFSVIGIVNEILYVSFVNYALFFMAALAYRWKLLISEEMAYAPDYYEDTDEYALLAYTNSNG